MAKEMGGNNQRTPLGGGEISIVLTGEFQIDRDTAEPATPLLVEHRPDPPLAAANASVHDEDPPSRAYDETLDRGDQHLGVNVVEPRCQPGELPDDVALARLRKHVQRTKSRLLTQPRGQFGSCLPGR